MTHQQREKERQAGGWTDRHRKIDRVICDLTAVLSPDPGLEMALTPSPPHVIGALKGLYGPARPPRHLHQNTTSSVDPS